MSRVRLPPETIDHVIDFLHDDLETLEQCILVSKSWVQCSRKHLFATVEFHTPADIEGWKRTFPNPSNSPAFHTRNLFIYCPGFVTMDDAAEGGWISSFSHVVRLKLDDYETDDDPVIRFDPFYTFISTLTSLTISSFILSCSQASDFIRSLPHLEDLSLVSDTVLDDDESDGPRTTTPFSTPPPLTGTLELALSQGIAGVTRRLLDPPNNLRFRKLVLTLCEKGPRSIPELVEACSPTLEYLDIKYELEDGSKNGTFPINLAKATRLKGVVFRCEPLNCGWIVQALSSMANPYVGCVHPNFREVTIHIPSRLGLVTPQALPAFELEMRGTGGHWGDLTCYIAYIWHQNRIRTKIVCPRIQTTKAAKSMEGWLQYLFGDSLKDGWIEAVREPNESR